MPPERKAELLAELEVASAEQRRCMGGVDPLGCVAAARLCMELRAALVDDSAMIEHLGRVVVMPRRSKTARPAFVPPG